MVTPTLLIGESPVLAFKLDYKSATKSKNGIDERNGGTLIRKLVRKKCVQKGVELIFVKKREVSIWIRLRMIRRLGDVLLILFKIC